MRIVLAGIIFLAFIFVCNPSINADEYWRQYDSIELELSQNIDRWIKEAKQIVGNDRGLDFDDLSIHFEPEETIHTLYTEWYESNLLNDINYHPFVTTSFFNIWVDNFVKNNIGMYLLGENTILINEEMLIGEAKRWNRNHDIPLKSVVMSLLIHEIVHAADDAQFDLYKLYRINSGSHLHIEMLIEGHAEQQTEKYCISAGCHDLFLLQKATLNSIDVEDEVYIKNNFYLKYGQGYHFFRKLAERNPSLTQAALKFPPSSVLELFRPRDYPDHYRATVKDRLIKIAEGLSEIITDKPSLKIYWPVYNDSVLPDVLEDRQSYAEKLSNYELGSVGFTLVSREDPLKEIVELTIIEYKDDSIAENRAKRFYRRYTNLFHSIDDEARIWDNQGYEYNVSDVNLYGPELTPHNSWSMAMNRFKEESSGNLYSSIFLLGPYLVRVKSNERGSHMKILNKTADFMNHHIFRESVIFTENALEKKNFHL